MQKDFHYYCIAVLARAAGFKKKEALTIAYASQYVDDATESEPIKVGELIFEPVRTAHIGLEAFQWSVQKRIFIPFHFIPPVPLRKPGDTFITAPDSKFARDILTNALNEANPSFRLCRIGIALHTYADTWAHQKFSGRENDENDVEMIRRKKNGKWDRLIWENMYLDFLPEIGHAEADHFPDYPFLEWKYKRKHFNDHVTRDNKEEFLKAARSIYDRLVNTDGAKKKYLNWNDIKPQIQNLIHNAEEDLDKRCDRWQREFKGMFKPASFNYDKYEWRNDALRPSRIKNIKWDKLKQSEFGKLKFNMSTGFYDSMWVQFHRAALKQRHYVLENLL